MAPVGALDELGVAWQSGDALAAGARRGCVPAVARCVQVEARSQVIDAVGQVSDALGDGRAAWKRQVVLRSISRWMPG